MKKYLLITLASLILTPSIAFAISDENVTKRRPDNAPAKIQVQEIRQERQELREDLKTNMQEKRSTIAESHAQRLELRFKFYFDRLSNIIGRFQVRLDLLKKDGKDVAAAQAKLDTAKTRLAEAKTKGEASIASFKAVDPTKISEQKTELLAARDLANAARKLYSDVNNLLKLALKELKNISQPAQEALWSKNSQ